MTAQADARIDDLEARLAALWNYLGYMARRADLPGPGDIPGPEYHGLRVLKGGKAS